MDSPRLEFSNGILFAIFRYRLSLLPFSTCFMLEKNVFNREKIVFSREGEAFFFLFCLVGPSSSEGNGGGGVMHSDELGTHRPAPHVIFNETQV
jgi:hypothetical protein